MSKTEPIEISSEEESWTSSGDNSEYSEPEEQTPKNNIVIDLALSEMKQWSEDTISSSEEEVVSFSEENTDSSEEDG